MGLVNITLLIKFVRIFIKTYIALQIRKDGSIIPESVYRRKHQDKLRKRVANDALASAIVKKTIDLEKLRKSEIERYLDDLAKVETVERVRVSLVDV